MANEINISSVTGLTITLQLYQGASVIGSSFSAIEISGLGEYYANMPSVPYGQYLILATVGTNVKLGSGIINWTSQYEQLDALAKLEGLDKANAMSVTPNTRTTGTLSLIITGDGENISTVTNVN